MYHLLTCCLQRHGPHSLSILAVALPGVLVGCSQVGADRLAGSTSNGNASMSGELVPAENSGDGGGSGNLGGGDGSRGDSAGGSRCAAGLAIVQSFE